MKQNTVVGMVFVLLVALWLLSGCTSNQITGLAVEEETTTKESTEKEEKKAEVTEKSLEEEKEEKKAEVTEKSLDEEILDEPGARKAEQKKETVEQKKLELEQQKQELKKELEQIDEEIEKKADEIADIEVDVVKKRSGKTAAKKKRKTKTKEQLDELWEQQVEEKEERVGEIIKGLQKEQELMGKLKELGEELPKQTISLTSDIATTMITEAKQLIDSKSNIKKALNDLEQVFNRADPPLQVKAGLRILEVKLEEYQEEKRPGSVQSLKKVIKEVVRIAENSAKGSLGEALTKQMKVEETLVDPVSLRGTAKRMIELDPMHIEALTKWIIAGHVLEKDTPADIIKSIEHTKETARIQDKSIRPELLLVGASQLLKTGNANDISKAKEEVKEAINALREEPISEDIFSNLGVLKSPSMQSTEVTMTVEGNIKIKDLSTRKEITDPQLISAAVIKMNLVEKTTMYAHNPEAYIEAVIRNTGYHKVGGGIYSIRGGVVYNYKAIGQDKEIIGPDATNIKNLIFNNLVKGGRELPLSTEFLQLTTPLKRSPLQRVADAFDALIFNQVHTNEEAFR